MPESLRIVLAPVGDAHFECDATADMSSVLARVGDVCISTPKALVHALARILQKDGILRNIAEVIERCLVLGRGNMSAHMCPCGVL